MKESNPTNQQSQSTIATIFLTSTFIPKPIVRSSELSSRQIRVGRKWRSQIVYRSHGQRAADAENGRWRTAAFSPFVWIVGYVLHELCDLSGVSFTIVGYDRYYCLIT
jgi:hypothetical protein